MINFIICDDEEKYRNMVSQLVTEYMMKNEMEYNIHMHKDFDDKFMEDLNKSMPFKIYILDIQTPSGSGIDIARIIRNKDVDSVIIFLTGHQELGELVMENEFLFLSFINKFNNCKKRLKTAIEKSIKVLKAKKVMRFKVCGTVYTIALDDIIYLTTDSIERKSIIKTEYTTFKVGKSLSDLAEELNGNFVQTHRSCIVNKQKVVSYNKRKREITFSNGETIDMISTRFEGEMIYDGKHFILCFRRKFNKFILYVLLV